MTSSTIKDITGNKLLKKVMYRPKYNAKVMLIIGLLLQVSLDWRLMGLGLFMIIMAGINLKFGQDHKVIDLYDHSITIYNVNEEHEITISLDDIVEWRCYNGKQTADYLVIKTADDLYTITTFNAKVVTHYLWNKLPQQEGRTKTFAHLKNSDEPSKWKKWFQNLLK
ncbi:MAG: hypothetical protein ACRCTA_05895 [Bacilli bacterium]